MARPSTRPRPDMRGENSLQIAEKELTAVLVMSSGYQECRKLQNLRGALKSLLQRFGRRRSEICTGVCTTCASTGRADIADPRSHPGYRRYWIVPSGLLAIRWFVASLHVRTAVSGTRSYRGLNASGASWRRDCSGRASGSFHRADPARSRARSSLRCSRRRSLWESRGRCCRSVRAVRGHSALSDVDGAAASAAKRELVGITRAYVCLEWAATRRLCPMPGHPVGAIAVPVRVRQVAAPCVRSRQPVSRAPSPGRSGGAREGRCRA